MRHVRSDRPGRPPTKIDEHLGQRPGDRSEGSADTITLSDRRKSGITLTEPPIWHFEDPGGRAVARTVHFQRDGCPRTGPELGFCWWQVLGSNQRRLSRRFYRPLAQVDPYIA